MKKDILVFDTETTGLFPKNCKSSDLNMNNLDKWPSIMQLSYVMFNEETNRVTKFRDYIIKISDNVPISEESIKIHGITRDISIAIGVDILPVLFEIMNDFENATKVIGHNLEFDLTLLRCEIMRKIKYDLFYFEELYFEECLNLINSFDNYICTMKETIDLCSIERTNRRGVYMKFPTLNELHFKLFETTPKNLHNAFNDILVCLRCYCKYKNNVDILEKNMEIKYIYEKLLF